LGLDLATLNHEWHKKVKKSAGLRTEIILNLTLLMGAAILFSALLILKLAERELLFERMNHLRASLGSFFQVLPQPLFANHVVQTQDLPLIRQWLGHWALDGNSPPWSLVDADLQPVPVPTDKSLTPDLGAIDQARLLGEIDLQLTYNGFWLIRQKPDESWVLATIPLWNGDIFQGAVQIRFPLDDLQLRLVGAQRLVVGIVALYGTVLVLFGAFFLNRNIVKPIRRVMTMAGNIAQDDLDQRVSEEGPREIADLGLAFNRMAESLRNSRQEREQYIASLQQANQELTEIRQELLRSERMASVGHLAAGMAHEIGNPLGAIIGYLEFLKSELPNGSESDLVVRSLQEAARIDRLVRDLLDYAAPDKGDSEPISLSSLAEETVALVKNQGGFDAIEWQCQFADDLALLPLNRHKLQQVLINLLINARDALQGVGRITVLSEHVKDQVRLCVADNGPGIAQEHLESIFDPFFTTKPPGRGRGLGLTVSYRIIREAGGQLKVHSEPGAGSVFEITFPSGK